MPNQQRANGADFGFGRLPSVLQLAHVLSKCNKSNFKLNVGVVELRESGKFVGSGRSGNRVRDVGPKGPWRAEPARSPIVERLVEGSCAHKHTSHFPHIGHVPIIERLVMHESSGRIIVERVGSEITISGMSSRRVFQTRIAIFVIFRGAVQCTFTEEELGKL